MEGQPKLSKYGYGSLSWWLLLATTKAPSQFYKFALVPRVNKSLCHSTILELGNGSIYIFWLKIHVVTGSLGFTDMEGGAQMFMLVSHKQDVLH